MWYNGLVMSTIKSIAISLLFIPFLAFAQSQPTLPSAGLSPESPFYFLDRLGENLQEFFTFNPEARAKLQIEFAGERISEIKVLVETKGAHTKGIDKAKSLLLANVASAAEIINQEKASGKDVSALAKDIDDQFDAREKLLAQTFLDARAKLLAERVEIKTKLLAEAQAVGDTAKVAELTQQLDDLQSQADDLKGKKDEIRALLREEKKKVEENMDERDQRQDEIDQNDEDQEEQNQEELEQKEEEEAVEAEESAEAEELKEMDEQGESGLNQQRENENGVTQHGTSTNQSDNETGTFTEARGDNTQEGE